MYFNLKYNITLLLYYIYYKQGMDPRITFSYLKLFKSFFGKLFIPKEFIIRFFFFLPYTTIQNRLPNAMRPIVVFRSE